MAQPGVAEALAAAAVEAEAEPDLERTLERLVHSAVATVSGVDAAGVSLLQHGTVQTVAATDETAAAVDRLQHRLQEGPCFDAITDHRVFRTEDIGHDERWPAFGPAAAEAGVRAILGFYLRQPQGPTLGALNLFAMTPGQFDDEAEHVGGLFAAHATVALADQLQQENLQAAIDTRDVIGMAKGILMDRHRVDDERAFGMLMTASNRSNTKLRDVAAWIVEDAARLARGETRQ